MTRSMNLFVRLRNDLNCEGGILETTQLESQSWVEVVIRGATWKHHQAGFSWSRIRRNFANSFVQRLGKDRNYRSSAKCTDGLQAVQRADELQPDLILLDIGLPSLNGIEVARRIRKLSPESKILFVSQESSADVVQEALGTGAHGYVVKIDAGSELLKGVNAVLRGDQFVGRRFAGHDFAGASDAGAFQEFRTHECY